MNKSTFTKRKNKINGDESLTDAEKAEALKALQAEFDSTNADATDEADAEQDAKYAELDEKIKDKVKHWTMENRWAFYGYLVAQTEAEAITEAHLDALCDSLGLTTESRTHFIVVFGK